MDSFSFPDPASGDFTTLRAVLQAACPVGITLAETRQTRLDINKYVWEVTYRHTSSDFPDPASFRCSEAKSILQSACPRGASIGTVCTETSPSGYCVWKVIMKQRKRISCFQSVVTAIQSGKSSDRLQRQHLVENSKLSSILIRVKRDGRRFLIPSEDVRDSDTPEKVFIDGIDCTRTAVKKTRFSRATFQAFVAKKKATGGWIRGSPSLLDTKKNGCDNNEHLSRTPPSRPSDEELTTSDVTIGNQEDEKSSRTSLDGSHPSYNMVPPPSYYSSDLSQSVDSQPQAVVQVGALPRPATFSEVCRFAKFRDERIIKHVRTYLAMKAYGMSGYSEIIDSGRLGRHEMLPVLLSLKSDNLPTGEALFDLYLDYCSVLGISRATVVQDLKSVRLNMST